MRDIPGPDQGRAEGGVWGGGGVSHTPSFWPLGGLSRQRQSAPLLPVGPLSPSTQ